MRYASWHDTCDSIVHDICHCLHTTPSSKPLVTKQKYGQKLDMVKKAYWLTHNGDSVDWDMQRDKFVQTVRESKSQNMSADAATANDDAYNGQLNDTLDGNDEESVDTFDGDIMINDSTNHPHLTAIESSQPHLQTSQSHRRRLQFDGDVFDGYEYNLGACPDAGSLGIPCAPANLSALCNKYDRDQGSFSACLDACSPAFCCIHDAPRELNFLAPNCNTDENCDQYNYCYIAWWKLADTIGPALFLRVEMDDDFYDLAAEEIAGDSTGSGLFTQVRSCTDHDCL